MAKQCTFPGCNNRLSHNNVSGRCKDHTDQHAAACMCNHCVRKRRGELREIARNRPTLPKLPWEDTAHV